MSQLAEFRKEKDRFFLADPRSPLSAEQRKTFTGLRYYPEDPSFRFEIELEALAEEEYVTLQTSTGDRNQYLKLGRFEFEVDGRIGALTVYAAHQDEAFLPFSDLTSGGDTYGAGRYLELAHLGGQRYLVDFNLAYNPWCAYSPDYSCPLPPAENRLSLAIRAGEMAYPGQLNQAGNPGIR